MTRSFRDVFSTDPIAIGRAPGRVNLMGEHTDYNGGYVLPTVIPQETTVEVSFGAGSHTVYSATLDRLISFDGGPLSDFGRYVGGCVRLLEKTGVGVPPLRIRIASTVPVGAGLSSSAALEVATLRALVGLLGLYLDRDTIAELAHRAEVEFAGVNCGIMDQLACSLGEPQRMLFLDTETLVRELLPLPTGSELLVMHCGVPRSLEGSAYNQRRAECAEAARRLGVFSLREIHDLGLVRTLPSPLQERARHVITENTRVLAARHADPALFGLLMNQSHASLRDDYAVSIPALNALVATLQQETPVFGARLTGAGFGGCCVALVMQGLAAEIGERITCRPSACQPSVIVPAASPS